MNINDNMLKVKNEYGKDIIIEVIDVVANEINNKNYIIYRNLNGEEAFISILIENENQFILDTIEDYEEFKAVENYELEKLKNELGDMTI